MFIIYTQTFKNNWVDNQIFYTVTHYYKNLLYFFLKSGMIIYYINPNKN